MAAIAIRVAVCAHPCSTWDVVHGRDRHVRVYSPCGYADW
jgi:hypothetical protein